MRINKFLAQATGISRRAADRAVEAGRVTVNGMPATAGQAVGPADAVRYDGRTYDLRTVADPAALTTILLHKPVGTVVSRDGQGSPTVYDLLPPELHHLKPVGRLDKFSSGLLLMTNDGDLANRLTHPSNRKQKVYEIRLAQPLQPLHRQMISDHGVVLDDGPSRLQLERLRDGDDYGWRITMHEGRNRQIRRTFLALGYGVSRLHRTQFGGYTLGDLADGGHRTA